MTLDEAIKILTLIYNTPPSGVSPAFTAAIHLGIEALKYCLADRLHHIKKEHQKLPGETKE